MIDAASIPHDPLFIDMYNIVHIDEEWFYVTKKFESYYFLQDEDELLCSCKSKNYIEKIMFLTVITRPRFDAEGNEIFSKKIGMFSFVTQEPAKRVSFNKAAGTLETKSIISINGDIIRSYLIEKIVTSIKKKWPRDDSSQPIFIQQDNAITHQLR